MGGGVNLCVCLVCVVCAGPCRGVNVSVSVGCWLLSALTALWLTSAPERAIMSTISTRPCLAAQWSAVCNTHMQTQQLSITTPLSIITHVMCAWLQKSSAEPPQARDSPEQPAFTHSQKECVLLHMIGFIDSIKGKIQPNNYILPLFSLMLFQICMLLFFCGTQ